MEVIKDIIAFIIANKKEIVDVVAYVIALSSIIVKLTPTPKDDAILAKIVGFIGKYIALNPEPKKEE